MFFLKSAQLNGPPCIINIGAHVTRMKVVKIYLGQKSAFCIRLFSLDILCVKERATVISRGFKSFEEDSREGRPKTTITDKNMILDDRCLKARLLKLWASEKK